MTSPFPLEGGRAGDGGEATASPATPDDSVDRFARTPKIKTGAIARARKLRAGPTHAEAKLWKVLRGLDIRFRRQAPIGADVVDFACHPARLVVEVDGGVHSLTEVALRDLRRDEWLTGQGYRVIRVPDSRIQNEVEAVLAEIANAAGVSVPHATGSASTPSQPFPLEGKGSSEF